MPTTTTTTNLFKGPSDWPSWIIALRSEAKAHEVWDYIDPNGTRTKPEEPRKPEVGDYEERIDPRTRAVDAEEEVVDYDHRATNSAELTARGLALFQFDIGLYRSDLKCYKEITTGLGKVVTWITNHLATGQNEHFFGNEETIREGLKKMLGLSTSYLKTRADNVRNKMLDHYAKIPTNTKKMEEWVNG